jgi:PBSX family phage terminase large subunit
MISGKQKKILAFPYSDYDALICDGAVRSGKTSIMTVAFVDWAMQNFSGQRFGICGKTVDSATKNIVTPYIGMHYARQRYSIKWRRPEKLLEVKRGAITNWFEVFGGKDESSFMLIQGRTFAGVLMDEVALMPESFVNQALARCSVDGAKLWFSCNPSNPQHWFYLGWIKRHGERNALYLHFSMEDNPSLSERTLERYKTMYSGVFYQRYIEGKWVLAEGLVYPMFDPEKHITDEIPEKGSYYVSMDYGTINPTAMGLWKLTGDTAVLVKEFYHDSRKTNSQKTDEEYYADLEELVGEIPVERVIIDPSAASFKETIRRHGRFKVKDADNSVMDGIRFTGTLLNDGKIKIHSSCVNTKAEFGEYRWDDKAKQDAVIKEHDHAMDMMRYFCYTMRKRLVKKDSYIPMFM